MKKNLLFVFTMLCALSFFTACSDDDNKKNEPEGAVLLKGTQTYSADKLSLKYGDSPLLGKAITFATEDGKTGTIKMEGVFDPSIIKDLLPSKTYVVPVLAPGVIPGEVTTMFNVDLIQEGNKYTFEGIDSNNGREMKYAGTVDSTSMTLSVNVTMPKNDLLGTWNLAPIVPGEGAEANKSQPMTMSWVSSTPIKIDWNWIMPDIPAGTVAEMPVDNIVNLLGSLYASPALAGALESITFQADGNIVASYKSKGQTEWQTSPINLAQYYIKDNKMYIQLNIDNIIATVKANKSTKASTKAGLVDIIGEFASLLSNGVPMNYAIKGEAATVSVDQTLLLPLLSLLSNETIVTLLLPNIPADYQTAASEVLKQLPEIIKNTTEMNVSLHLVKK
ncbi:DUF4925 domain-containing protein [uncultured Parabacteroides sp.]|uniref:DUF4925 domain-containing protein n=1 Tax=uncultured Parabacteroides sp. TaxID=512312 RepID=UPI0025F66C88|nr:DUF4925 domain-containing protein [uncultured Parabacteroides sp.]